VKAGVWFVLDRHASPSHGNFNFTATRWWKPYGPSKARVAYHTERGKQFFHCFEGCERRPRIFRAHACTVDESSRLTQQLTVHANVAESVGWPASASTGWTFMAAIPHQAPSATFHCAAIETAQARNSWSSGTITAAHHHHHGTVKAVPVKQIGILRPHGSCLGRMNLLARRWARVHHHGCMARLFCCLAARVWTRFPFRRHRRRSTGAIFVDVASLAWNE